MLKRICYWHGCGSYCCIWLLCGQQVLGACDLAWAQTQLVALCQVPCWGLCCSVQGSALSSVSLNHDKHNVLEHGMVQSHRSACSCLASTGWQYCCVKHVSWLRLLANTINVSKLTVYIGAFVSERTLRLRKPCLSPHSPENVVYAQRTSIATSNSGFLHC